MSERFARRVLDEELLRQRQALGTGLAVARPIVSLIDERCTSSCVLCADTSPGWCPVPARASRYGPGFPVPRFGAAPVRSPAGDVL